MTRSVSRQDQELPSLQTAGMGDFPAGTVYVRENGAPGLPDGKKCVLSGNKKSIEVRSLENGPEAITTDGTYLVPTDFSIIGECAKPKIRLYRAKDSRKKARSSGGWLLLGSSLAGIAAAIGALLLVILGPSGGNAVGKSAEAVVTHMDAADLSAQSSKTTVKNAVLAQECLARLNGASAGPARAFSVSCTPPSSPVAEQWAALIGGGGGLAVACIAMYTAMKQSYGFQKHP
jgi:hypothetical protein